MSTKILTSKSENRTSPLHIHKVLAKIERLLGLRYLPHQWTDFRRLLKPAAQELGFTGVDDCMMWLQDESQDDKQIQILAKHLTICESYFFREMSVLTQLREKILPSILRRKSEIGDRMLRIWCAGCSTGEEVYTMAILTASLLELKSPMQVHILGTDINANALEKARRGLYREWSFRNMSADLLNEWFVPDENDRYAVNDELRAMVEFKPLNLVDLQAYPVEMDLILCRNVLMYFTRQMVDRIVQGLSTSLRPDGWIVPSMTETTLINQPGLEGTRFDDVTLFRHQRPEILFDAQTQNQDPQLREESRLSTKNGEHGSFRDILPDRHHDTPGDALYSGAASNLRPDLPITAPPVVNSQHAFDELVAATKTKTDVPDKDTYDGSSSFASQNDHDLVHTSAALARTLADSGSLQKALKEIESAVEENKMCAYCRCIYGTILHEMKEKTKALKEYERALYLDPYFIPAHFTLGTLLKNLGKNKKGIQHLNNALRLIDSLADQDGVALWGEMTARELAMFIRTTEGTEV